VQASRSNVWLDWLRRLGGQRHSGSARLSGWRSPANRAVQRSGHRMTLTDARAELLAALEAAGVRAFYGMGTFAAPCARIFPSEPWVEVSGRFNGRRTQTWEVWAVAGRTDSMATFDELESMVVSIDSAIDALQS